MPSTTTDVPIVHIGSRRYVSVSDAAAIVGITRQGVHARIRKGRLETVTRGGRTYVSLDSIKNRRAR